MSSPFICLFLLQPRGQIESKMNPCLLSFLNLGNQKIDNHCIFSVSKWPISWAVEWRWRAKACPPHTHTHWQWLCKPQWFMACGNSSLRKLIYTEMFHKIKHVYCVATRSSARCVLELQHCNAERLFSNKFLSMTTSLPLRFYDLNSVGPIWEDKYLISYNQPRNCPYSTAMWINNSTHTSHPMYHRSASGTWNKDLNSLSYNAWNLGFNFY